MNVSIMEWFVSCVVKIIWRQRAWVSRVENGFAQEIKRASLFESIGGSNLKTNQGSYIFNTILQMIFNLRV